MKIYISKKTFLTKKDAELYIINKNLRLRSYKCEICKKYHLSSLEKKIVIQKETSKDKVKELSQLKIKHRLKTFKNTNIIKVCPVIRLQLFLEVESDYWMNKFKLY